MAVPNSLPVKLTDVMAEFGGGSNAPKNLGAYKAGGGYTPSGAKGGSAAIPTPNGAIPSAFPLNLGSFPGSKKEITVTQYWPYMLNFLRNFHHYSSNPPQTEGRNGDTTSNYNSGNNAGYISSSQVSWQLCTYNNINNASIPDSAQCTVFFMLAGSSITYSNAMSGGTGLSVRGQDASGAQQHMTPIATGRLNFVTNSGTGTGSESALSWATYNCSMKKITAIYNELYGNGSNGGWYQLIILPGNKTVKEYQVARDNTGFDIKPSGQIQPNEVVFGLRYDGGGDYEIQYTNQTFPNWQRYDGWWYNNGGFDIEANQGTNPVSLSTTVPQDYNPSNVWVVVTDNTGTVYSPGINPIWGTLSLSGAGAGAITFKRNGGVSGTIGGVAYDLPAYPSCPEGWWMGSAMTSMPGDLYWVNVVPQAGSGNPNGPGGFTQISSNPSWSGNSGSQCVCTVLIADNAAGTNPVTLGTVILSTASGGGGGGGGCVEVTSYLPGGKRASDVQVGDELQLADEDLDLATGVVSYSEAKVMPGYRVVTETGISLRCSDTAPIWTLNGYKTPEQLLGESVATRVDANGEFYVKWELVTSVESIGDIAVQHITVGDQNFWAGEQEGSYILHHNLKNNPEDHQAN